MIQKTFYYLFFLLIFFTEYCVFTYVNWLYFFGAYTIIVVAANYFQVQINNILYEKSKLAEGTFNDMLKYFCASVAMKTPDVYMVHKTKNNETINATFCGIGRKKIILLDESLIGILNNQELITIIAHEIGHDKHGHLLETITINVSKTLILMLMLSVDFIYMPFAALAVAILIDILLEIRFFEQELQADCFVAQHLHPAIYRDALLKIYDYNCMKNNNIDYKQLKKRIDLLTHV